MAKTGFGDCWGFAIPANKQQDTFRIVVLGSSVALGDNPDVGFNFSRVLQIQIEKLYPASQVEIYNIACPALNSNTMANAAQHFEMLKPDLVVVYMGNNEYMGPFGPAFSVSGMPPTTKAIERLTWIGSLRLVQVLNLNLVPSYLIKKNAGEILRDSVNLQADSPGRLRMYENYRNNVHTIIENAKQVGASVLLCSVASNLLNIPPIVSEHGMNWKTDDDSRFDELMASIRDSFSHEDWSRCMKLCEEAINLDPEYADVHYLYGRSLYALGEKAAACQALMRARDFDCLPVRADGRLNEILRKIADADESDAVFFVDVENAFLRAAEGNPPGNDFFYDHVHVFLEGNYIIAIAVLEQILREELLNETTFSGHAPLSLEDCRTRLGQTPLLRCEHLHAGLEELRQLEELKNNVSSKWLFEKCRECEEALSPDAMQQTVGMLQVLMQQNPDDFYVRQVSARALSRMGMHAEALKIAEKAYRDFPDRTDSIILEIQIAEAAGDSKRAASLIETYNSNFGFGR